MVSDYDLPELKKFMFDLEQNCVDFGLETWSSRNHKNWCSVFQPTHNRFRKVPRNDTFFITFRESWI